MWLNLSKRVFSSHFLKIGVLLSDRHFSTELGISTFAGGTLNFASSITSHKSSSASRKVILKLPRNCCRRFTRSLADWRRRKWPHARPGKRYRQPPQCLAPGSSLAAVPTPAGPDRHTFFEPRAEAGRHSAAT